MLSTLVQRPAVRILFVFVLLVAPAACGGDDTGSDDDGSADETTTTTAASGDDTATTEGTEPPSGESGESRATVTIGDETYEADLSGSLTVCISMGGAIGASGPIVGVDGSNLSIDIPPEDYETSGDDWDPPSIRVDLGEDAEGVPIDWRAGGDIVMGYPELEGKSQVDSFSVDGSSASGTATFIDFFQFQLFQTGQVDEPQPVTGSFSVECG